jgi:DNA-binding Lrp family transcriptional regulator
MARKLDDTDQKILALLAENARQSVKELARRIGLSRSAAQERLARLERDGVLAGYTIRRNDPAVNGKVAAYFIIKTRQAMCDDLAPHLRKIPEVVVFDSVAGETDGLVEVVADSMTRLQAVRSEIAALEDVEGIETSVILKRHFNRR